MRIIDQNGNTITEYDLEKGYLISVTAIREDAEPIDNATKWAWSDEDYEAVLMYVLYTEQLATEPTQLDRIEAQVAYLAMMTGNEDILEV